MGPPEGSTILTRETSRPLRPYRGALPPYDRAFLANRHRLRHRGEHDVDPRAVFRNFPSDIRVFRYDEHCVSTYRLTATDISHIRLCRDPRLARQHGAPPACKALGGHRHREWIREHRDHVRSSSASPAVSHADHSDNVCGCAAGCCCGCCRVSHTAYRISAFIWKAKWAPGYRPSMCISIAALMLGACLATGKFTSALVMFKSTNTGKPERYTYCRLS